jgi:hypothetical protein
MVFYGGSNIAHSSSADWCSSQVPTYELRPAIFVPFRASVYHTLFRAFDSAFAPKIACRSVLPLISVFDDQKSVPLGVDEPWAI